MHMNRREFLQLLAVAAASGMAIDSKSALAGKAPTNFYDVPRHGNVSFLHFTDCHAQLTPVWFANPMSTWRRRFLRQAPHLVASTY